MKKLIVGLILVGMVGVCWGDEKVDTFYDLMAKQSISGYISQGYSESRDPQVSIALSLIYQNQLLEKQNKLLTELIQILKDSQDPKKRADKTINSLYECLE